MAISSAMLARAVKCLGERPQGRKVASMGYPDILASPAEIEKLGISPWLAVRDDSEKICQRHSVSPRPIVKSEAFFKALDADLDVYDLTAERGGEIIADLNQPWIREPATYDLVLDPGTLEHCFNIAQAAFNMADMVKQDGYILHDNPLLSGNHGFYGMNPTWYHDFYGQNGFELISCDLYSRQMPSKVDLTRRFVVPAHEFHVSAVAKRIVVRPLIYPTQTKYRRSK